MNREQLWDLVQRNLEKNSDAMWIANCLMHNVASKTRRETIVTAVHDGKGCDGVLCFTHGVVSSIALIGYHNIMTKMLRTKEFPVEGALELLDAGDSISSLLKLEAKEKHINLYEPHPGITAIATPCEDTDALYQAIGQKIRRKQDEERDSRANRSGERKTDKDPIGFDVLDVSTGKTYRTKGSSFREAVSDLFNQLEGKQRDSAQESPRTSTDGKGAEVDEEENDKDL